MGCFCSGHRDRVVARMRPEGGQWGAEQRGEADGGFLKESPPPVACEAPFCGDGSQLKAWLAPPARSQCAAGPFGEAGASCCRVRSSALLHGEILLRGEAKPLGPETGPLGTLRCSPAWLRGTAVQGGEGSGDRQRAGKRWARWGRGGGQQPVPPPSTATARCLPRGRERRGDNRAVLPGGLPEAGDCCCRLASSSATAGL